VVVLLLLLLLLLLLPLPLLQLFSLTWHGVVLPSNSSSSGGGGGATLAGCPEGCCPVVNCSTCRPCVAHRQPRTLERGSNGGRNCRAAAVDDNYGAPDLLQLPRAMR
jgi:hypothetical protein